MEFVKTDLPGVILVKPDVHADERGFLLESYSLKRFADAGVHAAFVQDNHSCSVKKGVLRGLHFQSPPFAQNKLIRATRGSIWDVVVDLRRQSPAFGRWRGFELSAVNFHILFVPAGFAHGFCTLEENSEAQYKVDNPYSPAHERGIKWNDPDLAIAWPLKETVLSAKDSVLPHFKDFVSPF
jgi:dTDP-4-dehydrorhamnose 3,5-epimerase